MNTQNTPSHTDGPAGSLAPGPRSASFVVEYEGEVVVNNGWVEAEGERVVALAFDMKTKRPEVIATSCGGSEPSAPGVILSGEHALHINESKKGEPTHIVFQEYPGWSVHCADVSRYTLQVCLIKPNVQSEPRHE